MMASLVADSPNIVEAVAFEGSMSMSRGEHRGHKAKTFRRPQAVNVIPMVSKRNPLASIGSRSLRMSSSLQPIAR